MFQKKSIESYRQLKKKITKRRISIFSRSVPAAVNGCRRLRTRLVKIPEDVDSETVAYCAIPKITIERSFDDRPLLHKPASRKRSMEQTSESVCDEPLPPPPVMSMYATQLLQHYQHDSTLFRVNNTLPEIDFIAADAESYDESALMNLSFTDFFGDEAVTLKNVIEKYL